MMLDEQRALIEPLKANLHRVLKWRFGPKSELIDVDQFGLFADGSVVIELPRSGSSDAAEPKTPTSASAPAQTERRRAVRVLKNLEPVIIPPDRCARGAEDLPLLRGENDGLRSRVLRATALRCGEAPSARDPETEVFLQGLPRGDRAGPVSRIAADPQEHGFGQPPGSE